MIKQKRDIQAGMAAWIEKKNAEKEKVRSYQYDSKRVQFLSLEADIRTLLIQGYSRRSIWQYLSEETLLGCTYATFCRFVSKSGHGKYTCHSRQAPSKPPELPPVPFQPKNTPKPIVPVALSVKRDFTFDPRPPNPSIFERGKED